MRRLPCSLFALPLTALIGCGNPADPLDVPGPETQQYGPPAGTGATPTEAEADDHPAFSDPGQPPIESDVPTGAGGSATVDEDPGAFILSPPSDLQEQSAPDATAPAAEGPPAPTTPTVDQPEGGAGRP